MNITGDSLKWYRSARHDDGRTTLRTATSTRGDSVDGRYMLPALKWCRRLPPLCAALGRWLMRKRGAPASSLPGTLTAALVCFVIRLGGHRASRHRQHVCQDGLFAQSEFHCELEPRFEYKGEGLGLRA